MFMGMENFSFGGGDEDQDKIDVHIGEAREGQADRTVGPKDLNESLEFKVYNQELKATLEKMYEQAVLAESLPDNIDEALDKGWGLSEAGAGPNCRGRHVSFESPDTKEVFDALISHVIPDVVLNSTPDSQFVSAKSPGRFVTVVPRKKIEEILKEAGVNKYVSEYLEGGDKFISGFNNPYYSGIEGSGISDAKARETTFELITYLQERLREVEKKETIGNEE